MPWYMDAYLPLEGIGGNLKTIKGESEYIAYEKDKLVCPACESDRFKLSESLDGVECLECERSFPAVLSVGITG